MNLEDDILIDYFLRGNLSKSEISNFEKRLKTDKIFKESFDLEKKLRESLNEDSWSYLKNENKEVRGYKKIIETDEILNLKETIKKVDSEFKLPNKNKSFRLLYFVAAASIILFLGFQFLFQNASNEELYRDYLESSDLPSFASRDSASNDLVDAQSLFEKKDYKEALAIFNSTLMGSEKKAPILIYKGLSEIELSKYNEAQNTFDILINSDLIDAQKGYWYKSLLFLKKGEVENTKTLLNKIISESLYNKDKAIELLVDLE